MKTDGEHRVLILIPVLNTYRWLNEEIDKVSYGVKCKVLQMLGHQCCGTVEEMLQFTPTAWNQLPLVASVKYVLYFGSPPDHKHVHNCTGNMLDYDNT